jgi:hypothetical protein
MSAAAAPARRAGISTVIFTRRGQWAAAGIALKVGG